MSGFTTLHEQIIDFERAWGTAGGPKIAAIWARFDMSYTRYTQLLQWAIDQPEALEHDAQTVNRLRRLREKRARVRSGGFGAA